MADPRPRLPFARKLRSADQVERSFEAPVLAQIPHLRVRRGGGPNTIEGDSDQAQAFRALRSNLVELGVGGSVQSFAVTSPTARQGKTIVLANLAVGLAEAGGATIALEGDLRERGLAGAFGALDDGPGLAGILLGQT